MAHLTKATVAAAKAPANGQTFIRDDGLKGFALRVIPSGTKTFLWEGRIKRRVRRITIGRFPDLSVALARAEAMRIRTAIAQGRDPYSERQTEKHELVFGDLRKRYVEEHAKAHRRTWLRDERRLARCS